MENQKTNTFLTYPVDELEGFRRMASFGYLILAIASFVAMSFFIVHNLIGTEKPLWDENGINWTAGQLMYSFVGVSFSFGFVVFTWFFYQTQQDIKARMFILLVAVLFPMFAEVGQMMNRTEETRQEAATQSETFKTIQKRVENGGTMGTDTAYAPLIAAANAEKAKAETALSQCVEKYKGEKSRNECKRKQQQAIAEASGKIASYQQEKVGAKNTDSSQLAQDTKTLHQLENDEGFLQPIVRLLMGLGLPALLASFAVSLIIIGSIEVAMSYLGGLLREIKEAMRLQGADVSSPKVKARLRESPMVSALQATGEAIAEQVAQGQNLRNQVHQTVTGGNLSPTPSAPAPAPAPASKPYTPQPALTVKEALERVLALVTKGKPKGEKFSIQEVKKAYEVVSAFEGADRVPELDLERITAWLNSKVAPHTTDTDTHTRTEETDNTDTEKVRVNTRTNTDESGESIRVNTRTNTHTDNNTDTEEVADYTDKMRQYEAVKNAPVGAVCGCPWCGQDFTKKTYNHRFCKPQHKDDFWNAIKPERLQAKEGRDKRRRAKATA